MRSGRAGTGAGRAQPAVQTGRQARKARKARTAREPARASVWMAARGMLADSGPGAALTAGARLSALALDGGAGLVEQGQGGGVAGHQLEHPRQLADGVLVIVDLHQQAGVAQQAVGGVGEAGWA